MSPRYRSAAALADRAEGKRLAAESRARIAERDADRVERLKITVRARPVYGRDSEHSYFRDAARAAATVPDPLAVERLALHRAHEDREQRAITSSTLGGVVPVQPLWVSDALTAAVRSAAPLYDALLKLPLPDEGTVVQFSKFTTGASTGVQNPENSAVAITDPVIAFDNEPLSTIAGAVEYSFQVAERGVNVDATIANDLGAAFGAKVESELWVGTGTNGRVKGLTQASPGTSVAAGGQTAANNLGVIHNCFQQLTMAFGQPPDLLAVHPRRSAFWRQMVVGAPAPFVPPNVELVESPGAVGNLGAGTNEDWPTFVVRTAVPIATDGPQISFQVQQSGTSLIARSVLTAYVSFATSARPEGIARITSLTTPAFS